MSDVIGILTDSAGDQLPVRVGLPNFEAFGALYYRGAVATPVYPPDRGGCTGSPVINTSAGEQNTLAFYNVFPGFTAGDIKYISSNKIGTYFVVVGLDPLVEISGGGQFWGFNSDGTCSQSIQNNVPARYRGLIVGETIVKSINGTLRLKVVR
jgi:hypothetical protein